VNSLEKNFLKNYGLIVEVAYQLGSELVLTTSDENRTLNELNGWCAANGCIKIDYKKTKTDPSEINDLASIDNSVDENESDNETILFSDEFIDQALVEHNAHEDGFDVDFKEVKIGDQVWMLNNLNVEKFRNGDPIPYVETQEDWIKAFEKRQPAYCNYNNDPKYGQQYGKLYNWYAVNDSRGLAPEGWHIPSENEFNVLFSFIEDDDEVNDFKLKCDVSWGPDSDGTNETGFTALPAGYRDDLEGFDGIYDKNSPEESYAAWWSSSEIEGDLEIAVFKEIEYEFDGNPIFFQSNKGYGLSVRCIKGNLPEKTTQHTSKNSSTNSEDAEKIVLEEDELAKVDGLKSELEASKIFDCTEAIVLFQKYKKEIIGQEIEVQYEDVILDINMNAYLELENGEIVSGSINGTSNERLCIEILITEKNYDNVLNLLQQSLNFLTRISNISLLADDWILELNFYNLDEEFETDEGDTLDIDDFDKVTEGDIDSDIIENGFLVATPPVVEFVKIKPKAKNDVDQEVKEVDPLPVLKIVKKKLLEYNNEILATPSKYKKSISFKLPFVSNDEWSLLMISEYNGRYQMQFQCFDKNLVRELIAFKPDIIKKYDSGVKKDDLCENEGELFSAVVDFICLLSRKNMDLGDGTLIHYIGHNKYSKEINGVGQFQVTGDEEASIFSIYDHYEIDSQKWMKQNLQTSFFRNGELIKQAKTEEEWLWATENKVPAWCYYNNDPANGTKYGYLYNWYAINDPRGLAPKGWVIPSQKDYLKFLDNLKSRDSGVNHTMVPAGYRLDKSTFNFIDQIGFWWTSDEVDEDARFATLAGERPELSFGTGLKSLGLSVICIGEPLISKGLQELIDEGIAVNFYRNPKMLKTLYYFNNEDQIKENVKKYGSMFLDHLFAIPFKSDTKEVVDKVFKFLDKQLTVDYKSLMFQSGMHHPAIGIYNAASNELLGLGIGRKNRIFFVSTVNSINDQNYQSFSNFDYCEVISTTKWLLERAADAQIGIMDAIEEGDSESEEDNSKELEEVMNDLLIAYPYLPSSIADLSPGDF
jgi:uncharacterized protein (TIGR02145 family)